MHLRRLVFATLALVVLVGAGACAQSAPPAPCVPNGPLVERCEGNIIIISDGCAVTDRQDCGTDLCSEDMTMEHASCMHPCDSDGDCPSTEFCSSQQTFESGRLCAPSAKRFEGCESTSARSCIPGLFCLLLESANLPPGNTLLACSQPCVEDADCGSGDYACSAVVVTSSGLKTCFYKGPQLCDPDANPDICPRPTSCQPDQSSWNDWDGGADGGWPPIQYLCQ